MSLALTDEAVPPTERAVVIEPRRSLLQLDLGELVQYRELLWFLALRDIQVRYKQTAIGAAWSIVQPLLTMIVFSAVFGSFVRMPSEGIPYPIFVYGGLLVWTYFAQATASSSGSLVGDAGLLRKIYFPRLLIPLASVVRPAIDFSLSLLVLVGMMVWFGVPPCWTMLALPLFLAFAMVTALAVGVWLSALNVRYRDVGYLTPFAIQLWMFASPVVYPVSVVPEKWRFVYGLNPMTSVIEGARWALLAKPGVDFGMMALTGVGVLAVLLGGIVFFKRVERTFADVV